MLGEGIFLREVGDNIRSAMEENRMNICDLSRATGIDKGAISRYLRGQRSPSLKNLVNIAYVLNCDMDELVFTDEFID